VMGRSIKVIVAKEIGTFGVCGTCHVDRYNRTVLGFFFRVLIDIVLFQLRVRTRERFF